MKKYLSVLTAFALLFACTNPKKCASNLKAVDLGLSVLWASCNLGASIPEEGGDYYAWGETETKDDYSWGTYKWCNGAYNTLTKYNYKSSFGIVDKKAVLDLEDDVAHVRLGGNWRMPTYVEYKELMEKCTCEWTESLGVSGTKITGPSGNSIFLPAVSYRYDSFRRWDYNAGHYWSSSLSPGKPDDAYQLDFNSSNVNLRGNFRLYGLSVRPVMKETEPFKATGYSNGYGWVDLGLSVKWATSNIGAYVPEGYGDYYAWGETETKEEYSWETYKWCNGAYNTLTKYNYKSSFGTVDKKEVLKYEDDIAHVKLGGRWRMPTMKELDELKNNCTWLWTQIKGINGYKVTGPNGNSIFLPAAGYREDMILNNVGSSGNYWFSSLNSDHPLEAHNFCFDSSDVNWWYSVDVRCNGLSVRPVIK